MPVFVCSQKSFPIFADRIGLVCGHFVVKSVFESANPCIYWVFWPALLSVGSRLSARPLPVHSEAFKSLHHTPHSPSSSIEVQHRFYFVVKSVVKSHLKSFMSPDHRLTCIVPCLSVKGTSFSVMFYIAGDPLTSLRGSCPGDLR